MAKQRLSPRHKVAIALCVLASMSFLIAALVTFIQKGDWPAQYIYAGLTILAAMFIAIRRRASRGRE